MTLSAYDQFRASLLLIIGVAFIADFFASKGPILGRAAWAVIGGLFLYAYTIICTR